MPLFFLALDQSENAMESSAATYGRRRAKIKDCLNKSDSPLRSWSKATNESAQFVLQLLAFVVGVGGVLEYISRYIVYIYSGAIVHTKS